MRGAQKDDCLTRPTLAATSPASPESAKTASSPKYAALSQARPHPLPALFYLTIRVPLRTPRSEK